MQDFHAEPSSDLASVTWNGHPVFYRPGTSDMILLYRILMKPKSKREYQIPPGISANVVFDIGANIGASALLFAQQFPYSKIYCFEPVRANFEVLQRNIAPYPNIRAFNVGLGKEDTTQDLFFSDDVSNHGGFSAFEAGSDPTRKTTIEIKNPNPFIASLGIDHADIIKIDTEGAEYDILTTLPETWLAKASLVLGEIHGHRDFELLGYLERWFDVGVDRPVSSRLGHFTALKRN